MFLLTLIYYSLAMTLFTFNDEQHVEQWRTQDDVVMGGVSDSQVTYAAEAAGQKGVARFAGSVSLENNGGFAQIIYDQKTLDLANFKGIELHVRGDNQTYRLRLETDADRVAYAHSFRANDEWQRIRLAFADFEPTFRGEPVPDAPSLNKAAIRTVGFLISDKQEGEFELLIDEVIAYEE